MQTTKNVIDAVLTARLEEERIRVDLSQVIMNEFSKAFFPQLVTVQWLLLAC